MNSSEIRKLVNRTEFNTVLIIDTLYQQHLRQKIEPKFIATQIKKDDKELRFICTLRFDDKKWKTRDEYMKKREAKQDVADQAMIYLQKTYPEELRKTQRHLVEAFKPEYLPRSQIYGNGVHQMASGLHWSEMTPNVKRWYDEILKPNFPPCPRTLLHELVQKYHLGMVTYREIKNLPIHVEDRYVKFIVVDVGKRRFNPASLFDTIHNKYAKDHVATIAFEILYEEIEYEEKKLVNKMDLEYQRLIGNIIFEEDREKISKPKSYKDITNDLGVPVEEEAPDYNDNEEKVTYTTSSTLAKFYPLMFNKNDHDSNPGPITFTTTERTAERLRYEPYNSILDINKTFVSLIHELATKKRWKKPEYDYHGIVNGGIYATLLINGRTFTGMVYATRHNAKEDVSQLAYGILRAGRHHW